ncbi:Adenylate cyclase 1 [Delftia tsuruhatensis]|uniref:adenylate/guanylate cyclase domain-containing protein n=1 Tax=Delftia tsuruhatensis TaxID=180282 RepID=UPI001E80498B|nr:adenylate/guanylate cyclase domain-containing protein [Delftia tsuruhatensis]CAB5689670.1 Adenylate cyclase 1 [Delftia tsuruhatensis]CAC9677132.1 Adenylate cyclase 1 [Delftia tsuruhatensis]
MARVFRPDLPALRSLHWSSGLVLWAYAALHLANHALGLVSLNTAEAARAAIHGLWRSLPGTVLLYGALATHLALALHALWQRRSLRMPALEALRLALGLGLPLLLALHVPATRLAQEIWAVEPSYARIVRSVWNPSSLAVQLALLCAAWIHGCLGLHMALRRHAAWRRWQPLLLTGAVLLPVLAALGILSMAREIRAAVLPAAPVPSPEAALLLRDITAALREGWLAILALPLAGRGLWRLMRARSGGQGLVQLRYPDRSIQVPRGLSVLEASREHGIAHLSLCGGKARCSTCRVRVSGPPAHLPEPRRAERLTLERVKAPADVRLACQLRPMGDITVVPLFRTPAAAQDGRHGEEREVAILFVDLRRWSGLSERQWPVDLSWVLDQYFETVGQAVRDGGGLANQFIGDSVMAIFGLETDLATACRQAIHASVLIDRRMQEWGASFEVQFGQPLDFGIGLHAGRAVVGRVGFERTTTFTAVGEVVNTASRLQEYTKSAQVRLVLSLEVARLAGRASGLGPPHEVQVRGRSAPLQVLQVARPAQQWP